VSRPERVTVPALAGQPDEVRGAVRADLAFCHPAITAVEAVDADGVTVTVRDDLPAGDADLVEQVRQVVGLTVKSYRYAAPATVLWRHQAGRRDGGRAALDRFVAAHIITLGPGQYALSGPAARLRAALCARIERLAVDLGAEPWHLPSIEAAHDVVVATGYLTSHPQHVTFATRLPARYADIARFAADARERRLTAPVDPHPSEPTGFLLAPVVCHNVYRALAGARLAGPRVITAQGACYRFEGFRFAPLLRQWEFTMREVVLAGDEETVAAGRERALAAAQALACDLDLDAALVVASDPFFVAAAASARTFQLARATKLELRLGIEGSEDTAAASFNLHGRHFTDPMDIRDAAGAPLATGCVGFGVERWMAALIARWGEDPAAWPSLL
jgi:seryl-tRNA synthetase